MMSVIRLVALCDDFLLKGHSIDGSLQVGDVWYWWLLLCHDRTEVWLAFAKGMVGRNGSWGEEGEIISLWALECEMT